jgi:HemY protein
MMARLEEAERGDVALAREWLDRAAGALPDPRYICANCGADSLEWSSLCPRCGAFDALAWRTPAWAASRGVARAIPENRSDKDHAAPHPAELPNAGPAIGP